MDIVNIKRTVRARTEQMLGKAMVERARANASSRDDYDGQVALLSGLLDLLDMRGEDYDTACPRADTVLVVAAISPFLLPDAMRRWVSDGAEADRIDNYHFNVGS